LLAPGGERTILTHRGAGSTLTHKDIPVRTLEPIGFTSRRWPATLIC
jgi:hypothetical protein